MFDLWNSWESKVARYIQQYKNQGLLRADGKKLRDALQSKVKKELHNLRLHLDSIATEVIKSINKDTEQIAEDVKRGMRNLDEYVDFVRGIKNAEIAIKKCEEEKALLEQMKQLLSKNRDKD